MNNSLPEELDELFAKLGLLQDTSITFDLKADDSSIKVSYKGIKIDLLTLLVYGTRRLLKDLNFSLDKYIDFLKRIDNDDFHQKDKLVNDAINKLMNDVLNMKK